MEGPQPHGAYNKGQGFLHTISIKLTWDVGSVNILAPETRVSSSRSGVGLRNGVFQFPAGFEADSLGTTP